MEITSHLTDVSFKVAIPQVAQSEFKDKHILIIIENLPAPFDRRVWQEASSLKKYGANVSIICPKMKGFNKSFETIDGIDIYRHPMPLEGSGLKGYLLEYASAIFWELVLAFKIYFKKKFDVIHGCNPPDLIFLTALPFKLFGVKFVFDHHDINPELFIAKFNKKNILYRAMLFFERLTFMTANYSIATNESYKFIALTRGKKDPEKVTIVRSGPNLNKLKISEGNPKYKKGKKYLIGYVGVIGEQEGLNLLMESIKIIKNKGIDVHLAIIGSGTYLENVIKQARSYAIDDMVDFYGRVEDDLMLEILNTCDICVNPDKPTEMNNLSTMNKVMEYMALGKPMVQFNLKEGKYSAKKASLYAENNNVEDFANKIIELLSNSLLRHQMGEYGYQRVKNELCWDIEEQKLIKFYKKVLNIN